jgi:sarcosine oxidase subunit gamma
MPDPVRTHPLERQAAMSPAAAAVTLVAMPPMTRLLLRGGEAVGAAAAPALGFALPAQACRAAENGGRAALWLGPDEWLILAPEAETAVVRDALAGALAGLPHSLVDVSHRSTAIDVTGAKAADVLNAFVALDLDAPACPVGMCTRTLLGKAEIVLWRRGPEQFRIDVARSFAAYVWGCLEQARLEHTT